MRTFFAKSVFGAMLALCTTATFAQTLEQCSQSFKGFDGSRIAAIKITSESISCERLEKLRISLVLDDAEIRQLHDANARIAQFRHAINEAKSTLDKEARATTPAAVRASTRSIAATWATYKALKQCVDIPPRPLRCYQRVHSAQRSVARALDSYYDDYQTKAIFRNSSEKLISILNEKLTITESGAVPVQAKADSFLATCALVAQECLPMPLEIPALP